MAVDKIIIGTVFVWIFSSSLSQIFTKAALNDGISPNVLVFLQMLCGSMFAFPPCFSPVTTKKKKTKEFSAAAARRTTGITYDGLFWVIGFLNTAGNALTLWSMILVNPAITHVSRATEPVFVAVVSWFLFSKKPSGSELVTLCLMCVGTCLMGLDKMTAMRSAPAQLYVQGFLLALTANLCMALRNCFTKLYSARHGKVLNYGHISLSSALFGSILMLTHLSDLGPGVSIPQRVFVAWNKKTCSASWLHVFYNLASFHVLASTDTLTHSIVKLTSRFVTILSLAIVFRTNTTNTSFVSFAGIFFIMLGAAAFAILRNGVYPSHAPFALSKILKRRSWLTCLSVLIPLVGLTYLYLLQTIKPVFLNGSTFAAVKSAAATTTPPLLAYYSPYSGEGNLGDVILAAEFDYFFNKTCRALAIADCRRTHSIKTATLFVVGGGSLLRKQNLDPYEKKAALLNPQLPAFIFGSGWDDYSEKGVGLALTRDLLANRPVDVSKYAKEIPFLDIGKALHPSHTFGGVRGPLTKKILEKANLALDVPIVGDAGLLSYTIYPPRNNIILGSPSPKLLSSLPLDVDTCASIFVLNFGRSSGDSYVETNSATKILIDDFILPTLQEQGSCIVALPVRGKDVSALERIESVAASQTSWKAEFFSRYVTIKAPEQFLDFSFVNELYGMATLSVNYKLHAMILSASATTPFLCFGYHLKIYDFAAQVGLPELIVDGDKLGDFKKKLEYLKSHRQEIRRHLYHVRKDTEEIYDNIFVKGFSSVMQHNMQWYNKKGGEGKD